jgi:hypothetical protein
MVLREPPQRPFINEGAASVLALPPFVFAKKNDIKRRKGLYGPKIAFLFFEQYLYFLKEIVGFRG